MNGTLRNSLIIIAAMVLLGSLVVGVLLGSAVYGWRAAIREGNEAATLQNLKTIAAVEVQYYNTHGRRFGTFNEMIREGMLTSKFAGDRPSPDGYLLKLAVTPNTSSQSSSYTLNADPQSDTSGRRHFYINSNNFTIHFNRNQPAGANDPPLGEP